jgi:hypothetical protein
MFKLIQDLSTEVAEATLRSLLAGLLWADLLKASIFVQTFKDPKGAGDVLKAAVCQDVLTSFNPMIELFSKYLSDKTKPGDLLDSKLADLRAEVNLLTNQVKIRTRGPTFGSPAQATAPTTGVHWNLNDMSLGGPSGPPQPQDSTGSVSNTTGEGVTGALLRLHQGP